MALSTKITFSEEQAMLQDVAVNFCREKVAIGEVRRQIASDSGFDRELWKEISELGWLAVAVPEEFGGTALSLAMLSVADLPPERRRRETVIDETRRSFTLDLAGVTILRSALITDDKARAALRAIRDAALLLASAEAAGGIAGTLELIVGYLNDRKAFGKKIGSYQSLKHTCSDILIGLERARSHVEHAASLIAAGDDAEVPFRR